MRADPDVIMVGGMDSQVVGERCLQAAITGHLVLSTLHAQTTAAAITRMLEIGLEPFMLAETLVAVMAVRLARRVCQHCAEPDEPAFGALSPFAERARAGGYSLPSKPRFLRGQGCEQCSGYGYRGRIGLFEVMEMDPELCRMVLEHTPARALQEAAVKKGMTTLVADGMRKAAEGITTVVEAMRVTQGADV
jgi:general secretion pathway protein E